MKVGDYAFWDTDSFPYLDGGVILTVGREFCESVDSFGNVYSKKSKFEAGKCEIKGYGTGYWFTPKFTMSPKLGKVLRRDLQELTGHYHEARKAIYEGYRCRLTQLLKSHKINTSCKHALGPPLSPDSDWRRCLICGEWK